MTTTTTLRVQRGAVNKKERRRTPDGELTLRDGVVAGE